MTRLLLLSKHLTESHKQRLCESLGKPSKSIRIAFCENAAELYTEKPFVEESKSELKKFGFQITDFDLKNFQNNPLEIVNFLSNYDATFFTGGNVTYLNYLFSKLNLSSIYADIVNSGRILHIGTSAGAIICESNMTTGYFLDSDYPPPQGVNNGLGLIGKLHVSPHYGDKPKYTHKYEEIIKYNINKGEPIIPLTNTQGIWFENDDWEIL